MKSQEFKIERCDSLQAHPKNPNVGDITALRESIRENGFYSYCVAQVSTRRIIAGNHRVEAAVAEGVDSIPVFWLDVDDDDAVRILVADNRAAEFSGTDLEALKEALDSLETVTGTGYNEHVVPEIESLLSESSREASEEAVTRIFSERVRQDLHDSFWSVLEGGQDFDERFRSFLDAVESLKDAGAENK